MLEAAPTLAVCSPLDGGVGRLSPGRAEWARGYYCAVAVLLREQGHASAEVRSLYAQGGNAAAAHPDDAALFTAHGLTPNVRANRPAEAGGVRLARDSGEAAARQPYAACRSGSG